MSSDRRRDGLPAAPANPPGPASVADPYSTWLDRVQRARGRHAAITRNLYSWSNYKNWADRVKTNWDDAEK
jgi:hypothetical protein